MTVDSHPIEDPALAIILMSTLEPDSMEESGVMSKLNVKVSPLSPGSASILLVGLSKETQPSISSPPTLWACMEAVQAVFPVLLTWKLFTWLV